MGHESGNLTRMWHAITYSLSPSERHIFWCCFSQGIPNMLLRSRACILHIVPFVVFYPVYTWGTQEFEKSNRKNSAAHKNDK
ncbi:cytochrome b-c1 complex subunit 8-like [Neomonachus schauinslandi]|uniref:Cytochrome b-c1 complex subunit 8 n=1 Tax=Neomonachus schauinslandi TaxID=29088 RepID=A0A8M1MA05_NEOSC|nr:cytochrome b-c1 complex subunit 8-like [Neomonachus schauinslandi]